MPVNCYQMNRNETFGIYNTTEHISLLKYSKTACGVDFPAEYSGKLGEAWLVRHG